MKKTLKIIFLGLLLFSRFMASDEIYKNIEDLYGSNCNWTLQKSKSGLQETDLLLSTNSFVNEKFEQPLFSKSKNSKTKT